LILFDTSLSMQWEKLERSYQALETRSCAEAGRQIQSEFFLTAKFNRFNRHGGS